MTLEFDDEADDRSSLAEELRELIEGPPRPPDGHHLTAEGKAQIEAYWAEVDNGCERSPR
jgi:hypothetical protein